MASKSKTPGKSKRSTQVETSESCSGSSNNEESTSGKRLKRDVHCPDGIQESSGEGIDLDTNKVSEECNSNFENDSGSLADLQQNDKHEAGTSNSIKIHKEKKSKKKQSSLEDKNYSLRSSHRSSSSDSDSDNSSDKTDSNCDSDNNEVKVIVDEDNDDKYDPTPNTPKPKHKWIAPLAVVSRQYGLPQNYSPDYFRYNCYGSLHVVERLELMYKMKKHDGCVNALNFNSTGTKLASGSDDLDIVVWDWANGEPFFDYNSGHRSNVFQAKFMPLSEDGFIVSCGRDGQVRVGEISSSGECKKTRKLAQHKGAAHKLAVQMDSPHTFFSCGEDAVVFGIDLRKEKPDKLVLCKEKEKKVALYSIYVNPLKSFEFAVGGRHQFVKVYDTRCIRENSRPLKDICPEHLVANDQKNVTSVVYNYNGEEILASYNDEDIYSFEVRETDNTKYLHRYKGHRNSQTVKGVNYFGPKSEFIISGSDCGYIFFWERESEHVVKYMYGDEGGVVNCLEPSPTMPVLSSSGLDDDIKIWVPSCELPPDMSGLKKHLIANMKEREEERRDCPEAFFDQTIWFLMQHLARSRGRRASGSLIDLSSSSDSDSHEEDTDVPRDIQCNQS